MAISLETINVGVENQATGSDSLFEAFTKTQNNFAKLANTASPYNTFQSGLGIQTESFSSNGKVTITNTGVVNIIGGTGITASTSNGNVTLSISGSANGTLVAGVTNVGISSTTLSVSNSPVISNGVMTVNLATVDTIEPGEYIAPTIVVDAYGRISSITDTESTGTVTSVAFTPGEGIAITGGPITSSGTINVTNTGVTRLNAGPGILLSGHSGEITVSSSNPVAGTVTSIEVTSNTLLVTGGPITSSGSINIELPESDTMTGSFTAGNLTSSGNLVSLGNANIVGTFRAGSTSTFVANVLVTANANVTGNIVAGNITSSTNLVSLGNANVVGTFTGGNIVISGTTDANSSIGGASSGALVVTGGVHIAKRLNVANGIITGNILTSDVTTTNVAISGNIEWNSGTKFYAAASGTVPTVYSSAAGWAELNYSDNQLVKAESTGVSLTANALGASKSWTFTKAGTMTAPGNITATSGDIYGGNLRAVGGVLLDSNNGKYVALSAQDGVSANYAWGWPVADGSANSFISTDGAGVLSFRQPASSAFPATASSSGIAGQIAYDNANNWMFICVATNTWKRTAIASW